MEIGTQIAYVPTHAFKDGQPDFKHPDVQFGFVTEDRGETAFCRYWLKAYPTLLRTVANSESTPKENLFPYVTHDQEIIERSLVAMGYKKAEE